MIKRCLVLAMHLLLAAIGFAAFNVAARNLVLWLPGRTIPSDLPSSALAGFQACQRYCWEPQTLPLVKGLEIVRSPVLQQRLSEFCIVERQIGFRPQWFVPEWGRVSSHPPIFKRFAIKGSDSSVTVLHPSDRNVHLSATQILIESGVRVRTQEDLDSISLALQELLPRGSVSELRAIYFADVPTNHVLRLVWSRRYEPNISYRLKINQDGSLDGSALQIEDPRH